MRELHPNKLLNAVEESPSSEPVHQQYEGHESVEQTYNPQTDTGHDNAGYDRSGYVHVGYDQGGYVPQNYDHNREPFYEQDNSGNYNTPHDLEYQQGYNGAYDDQRYVHHQGYSGDDY